jgi:hypothetical protein
MRQRLMQVLGSEDQDDVMTDVVRRFWTRAKPLSTALPAPRPPLESRHAAQVVDLAAARRVRAQQKAQDRR